MTLSFAIPADLIELAKENHFDLIAHGCTCMCVMGAGVARSIRLAFPSAWEADRKTVPGDLLKLGSFSLARHNNLYVANCYTQYALARPGQDVFDYTAFRDVLGKLADQFRGIRIGMPKIGAGLAGGDWQRISADIEAILAPVADVTIVIKE